MTTESGDWPTSNGESANKYRSKVRRVNYHNYFTKVLRIRAQTHDFQGSLEVVSL